jgi:hypothetical protein
MQIHQQHHGYLRGHQLLGSSVRLERIDQEVIDRLSDIAGSVQGVRELPSYLSGYPLPSRQFFVFARTWYDREASRAGCVLTHSLLVPAEAYAGLRRPSALRALHRPFPHADRSPLVPIVFNAKTFMPLEPERENAAPELIEALFLEQRKPVLWFADNPEVAILRIIDALWSSIRANFAFQSYALKPRWIGDRPFDLMAAPRLARSRFADWPGRRVEGAGAARHAWTSRLASEIFEASEPDLSRADPLGVLRSDKSGDPAALRLSLLWNEMGGLVRKSPGAALGMLDILASSALPKARVVELLQPIVEQLLADNLSQNFAQGPGKFTALLLEKLSGLPTPEALDTDLAYAVRNLIADNPIEGLRLLTDAGSVSDRFESLIDAAFAGAINKPIYPIAGTLIDQLPKERVKRLFERQPALASTLLRSSLDSPTIIRVIDEIYSSLSSLARGAIRARVVPLLTKESAALVRVVAHGLDKEELHAFVAGLAKLADRDRPAVFGELIKNAKSGDARLAVRDTISIAPLALDEKARLIAKALRASRSDLEWLLKFSDRNLARLILENLKWPPDSLAYRGLETSDAEMLVRLLHELHQEEAALSVVRHANIEVQQKIDSFERYFDHFPPAGLAALVLEWIEACFPVRTEKEILLAEQLLALPTAPLALATLTPAQLAGTLVPAGRLEKEARAATLHLLAHSPEPVAPHIARSVDRIISRFTHGFDIEQAIFADLALLLERSAIFDLATTASAALGSLDFAYNRTREPASDLVKAAFLILYPMVKGDRQLISTGIFTAPVDRPTKMRRDLANAYLIAIWPPRDLAIIAVRLSIADKIFSFVADRWGGPRYLRQMLDDLDPGRTKEEKQARKLLREYT